MLLVVTYKSSDARAVPVWQIIRRDGMVLHDNLTRKEGLKKLKELEEVEEKVNKAIEESGKIIDDLEVEAVAEKVIKERKKTLDNLKDK